MAFSMVDVCVGWVVAAGVRADGGWMGEWGGVDGITPDGRWDSMQKISAQMLEKWQSYISLSERNDSIRFSLKF